VVSVAGWRVEIMAIDDVLKKLVNEAIHVKPERRFRIATAVKMHAVCK
jgi:hypothetical protein